MCQGILECEVLVGTRSAEGIMASGHVNRIKRPNTWLHRPMLQNREESSCQTGAVHTWHFSDLARCLTYVRKVINSGHVRNARSSPRPRVILEQPRRWVPAVYGAMDLSPQ